MGTANSDYLPRTTARELTRLTSGGGRREIAGSAQTPVLSVAIVSGNCKQCAGTPGGRSSGWQLRRDEAEAGPAYHTQLLQYLFSYSSYFSVFTIKYVLFKRKHRLHRSLKQEGPRKGTLARTGGQNGGMFGESTGLVDYIPSDAPLGGN
jgi:hypothetical protein